MYVVIISTVIYWLAYATLVPRFQGDFVAYFLGFVIFQLWMNDVARYLHLLFSWSHIANQQGWEYEPYYVRFPLPVTGTGGHHLLAYTSLDTSAQAELQSTHNGYPFTIEASANSKTVITVEFPKDLFDEAHLTPQSRDRYLTCENFDEVYQFKSDDDAGLSDLNDDCKQAMVDFADRYGHPSIWDGTLKFKVESQTGPGIGGHYVTEEEKLVGILDEMSDAVETIERNFSRGSKTKSSHTKQGWEVEDESFDDGPYKLETLRNFWEQGRLSLSTRVRKSGSETDWTPLKDVIDQLEM
ncbi:MAG: GYF domain-containing protein [bacterium]